MSEENTKAPYLRLQGLDKKFIKPLDFAARLAASLGANLREEVVHAVNHVNLDIAEGEVVSLVGESGCGKSTLGRMVAGILPATEGGVYYRGQHIATMPEAEARDVALKIQMIFQDPFASLNPRLRVRDIVGEAPLVHGKVTKAEFEEYLDQTLLRVGLDPAFKKRYPHQFSGGQRQRIGIARALAVQPECIVCDESVAALDVSIQAQILNLFMKLREDLNLTYLFISHDLGVVEHISDRVAIMYLGRVVELGETEDIFSKPNHPYTQALLAGIPRLENRHAKFASIEGEIPSPLDPPSGCHFHPRCPHASAQCRAQAPELREVAPSQWSACHLNEGL